MTAQVVLNRRFPAFCTNFEARMMFANCDKERLIEFVAPKIVADLGTGTGSTLWLLKQIPDIQIVGFDYNDDHLSVARRNHPDAQLHNKNLLDSNEFVSFREYFDTVIISSVLHEIEWPHGEEGAERVIELAHFLLKAGGILIVRDGVKPRDASKIVKLHFLSHYGMAKFFDFVDEYCQRAIGFQVLDMSGELISLSYYDLHDFLCKYYFEGEMWENDMNQIFGMRTAKGYEELVQERFNILYSETYIASYLQHLWKRDFEIIGGEFPDSHILIVARKENVVRS